MTDGLFIAFEGGDGAGKSTQVALLREALERSGRTVTVTRQPGGTPLGQQIRDLVLHGDHVAPRAEALLFAADKAHHVETLVRPALQRGEVVISDRYTDSSVAITSTSACEPSMAVRHSMHSPHPADGHCSAAAKARAATDLPEPGGPVNSQACVIAVGSSAAVVSSATASGCPTTSSQTIMIAASGARTAGERASHRPR